MATIAIGTATFTLGGAETSSFSWLDASLGTPVTFGGIPKIVGGPSQTVQSGEGAGVPYFNGAAAITATGATVTMASPPDCTVVVVAIG